MAMCKQCGATLLVGRDTCAACGALSSLAESVNITEEAHRLLAQANLLRIRGQFDEAIGVCTRILRLDSFNAAAHSLLGDIYAEQQNYREALGWYKLAVQLNPHNAADRRKMDDMIDRVFQGDQRVKPPAAATPRQVTEKPEGTEQSDGVLMSVLFWISSLHPVTIILGCTALFAAIAGIIVMCISSPGKPSGKSGTYVDTPKVLTRKTETDTSATDRRSSSATAPSTMPSVIPPPPDTVENGPIPGLPGVVMRPQIPPTPAPAPASPISPPGINFQPLPDSPRTRPSTTPDPAPPTEVPPFRPLLDEAAGNMNAATQRARSLKTAVVAEMVQLHAGTTNIDVSIDPQTNAVAFSYTIPRMRTAVETKQGLIYAGLHLIWAAQRHSNASATYVLQGSAYPVGGGQASLAFFASIASQQALSAQRASDYRSIQRYLGNPYWRDDLHDVAL